MDKGYRLSAATGIHKGDREYQQDQVALLAHPRIHKGPNMFLLARTLEPSPQGVPLELYCYTNTTVWVEYEAVQGGIFDHLIAMLPQFGLCLYQRSSDYGEHYGAAGAA